MKQENSWLHFGEIVISNDRNIQLIWYKPARKSQLEVIISSNKDSIQLTNSTTMAKMTNRSGQYLFLSPAEYLLYGLIQNVGQIQSIYIMYSLLTSTTLFCVTDKILYKRQNKFRFAFCTMKLKSERNKPFIRRTHRFGESDDTHKSIFCRLYASLIKVSIIDLDTLIA